MAECGPHEHYSVVRGTILFEGPTGGWGQGMGEIVLTDEACAAWRRELADLFGVEKYEDIVGRNCFVLRSWPSCLGQITGIEVDGKRWTVAGFVRRHFPDKAETPLQARVRGLRNSIERAAADIQRWNREIEHAANEYIDWEAHS